MTSGGNRNPANAERENAGIARPLRDLIPPPSPPDPTLRQCNSAGDKLLVNDTIADNMLQQILCYPAAFDVVATTNLNGDYLSDALAAQVGGLGITPGANINFTTGRAIFEATHGTAPDLADTDLANPSSLILSGVMMFDHVGWHNVAGDIAAAVEETIGDRVVTSDLARLMPGVTPVRCSEFAREVVDRLEARARRARGAEPIRPMI